MELSVQPSSWTEVANIEVRITFTLLSQLIRLADWQLRDMGYNPDSITAAYLKLTDSH
jgi:hypothetical protein